VSASPPARDRVRRIWLTFVGASLALVLLGAAYVQWRQYELLDGTAQYQNDALGWSFFQLETENLRLRSEIQQAITELLLELVGPYALPYQREYLEDERWNEPPVGPEWAGALAPAYFNYRKVSIYGGSNEIQHNIIAKAILGF